MDVTNVSRFQTMVVLATAAVATSLAQVAVVRTTDPLVLGTLFVATVLVVFFVFVLLPALFR